MSELKVQARECDIEPMVQTEDLRAGFAERLKKAMADKGLPEWGAGARLAKITGVTPKATSKWLNGEAVPGPANLLAIAEELCVRREWLEYGEGLPQAIDNAELVPQPSRYYRFPVVSSVVAGGWGDAIQAYEPGAEDRFEKTDTKVKGPAFWLEVEGDSMTSLSGPSIPEGMLILVDTGIEPQPGHLVVAKLDTEEKATFKKLVQDGGKLYLKPLNTGYNPIEINGNCRIIGVVREAKMKLL